MGYAKEILDDDLLEEFYQENICYSTFGTWTMDIHLGSSFMWRYKLPASYKCIGQGLELNSKSYLKNFLVLKKFVNDYYTQEFREAMLIFLLKIY